MKLVKETAAVLRPAILDTIQAFREMPGVLRLWVGELLHQLGIKP